MAAVQDGDVKFIRPRFTDILGQRKSFAITKEELDDALTQVAPYELERYLPLL